MKLFEPLDINGMVVPNRIMVPAMVTRLATHDGDVTDAIRDRYVRYAEGEAGLIVVEAMAIHHSNAGPLLRISDDRFVPGLAEVTRRIHDTSDSKVVPQIIHFMKIARSGWRQTVDMLETADIDLIVEQFGQAARRTREAGFDGVELHSAHGYTLASFLSRRNGRKDDYDGRTLEGRLRLIGRVMAEVRRQVGHDFPVCVRIVADEFIRGGYTVEDSKLIALRLAQLGFDYISLSVGGKFEDAEHVPGHVMHAYSGYSGERCMPGRTHPRRLHVPLAAEIRAFVRAHGFTTPIAIAGKLADPDDAERVLADGAADLVAIARGLLADPDWPKKVRDGQRDRLVGCSYCNVCKELDGNHKEVNCFLWPKGANQAPPAHPDGEVPGWGAQGARLRAAAVDGVVKLNWAPADGDVAAYEIRRVDERQQVATFDVAKGHLWSDRNVLGGMHYEYYVRARDAFGRAGLPSEVVRVAPPLPDYAASGRIASKLAPTRVGKRDDGSPL